MKFPLAQEIKRNFEKAKKDYEDAKQKKEKITNMVQEYGHGLSIALIFLGG